jgi:replicative DNA helicase
MPVRFFLASEFTNPILEKELLAAIAAKPEVYFEVLDLLPKEALTQSKQAFIDLAKSIEQGKPLLRVEGKPTLDPLKAAKELSELYQKRLLADLVQSFLEKLRGDFKAAELISSLEDGLAELKQAFGKWQTGEALALSDLVPKIIEDIASRREALKEQGTIAVGLPTGISKLDQLLGGLQPGLHLLAAEPAQGKTTFTLQVASFVAKAGYPVLFVSFEESLSRLTLKVICAQAGLEAKKFSDGYFDQEELKQAVQLYSPNLSSLYFIEGTTQLTVSHLKARALQLMSKWKSRKCLVIVDYLQRWAASRKDFSEFRHIVSGLVSELRELAMRLDSPVIVISSQNRPGQGTSNLTSLKESGDLEYSADTAMFLVEAKRRRAVPPDRALDLVIEKNRYGDRGEIEFIFKPDIGIFREQVK